MNRGRIVAVGAWPPRNTSLIGSMLAQAWPVDDTGAFDGLLNTIDEADRALKSPKSCSGDVDDVESQLSLPRGNRRG